MASRLSPTELSILNFSTATVDDRGHWGGAFRQVEYETDQQGRRHWCLRCIKCPRNYCEPRKRFLAHSCCQIRHLLIGHLTYLCSNSVVYAVDWQRSDDGETL